MKNQTGKVGIDIGIKQAIVCSDGQVFENPRIELRFRKKLRMLQKQLSRRKKGGSNWKKTVLKLQKLYYRIQCCRLDWIHKATSKLSNQYSIICLEDLNVKGMVKNHKLAKAILDVSFYEIKRQFNYKADEVWFVDRFEATSKACSECGRKHQNLTLQDRTFVCPHCGFVLDRDLNAAINIVRLAKPEKPVAKRPLAFNSSLKVKVSNGQESHIKVVELL